LQKNGYDKFERGSEIGYLGVMQTIELIEKIEKRGWTLFNVRGEHYQYRHPDMKGKVTMPPVRSTISKKLAGEIFTITGAEGK